MSYILEALRKSESERHQGEVPNLGANPMLIHAGRNDRPLWPYLLAGALLLNAVAIGAWWLGSQSGSAHNGNAQGGGSTAAVAGGANSVAPRVAPATLQPLAAESQTAQAVTAVPPVTSRSPAVVAPAAPVAQQTLPGAIPGLSTSGGGMTAPAVDPSVPGNDYQALAGEPVWGQPTMAGTQASDKPLLITPDTARRALAYDPELGYMDDTAPVPADIGQSSVAALSQVPADTPAIDVPRLEELPTSFQARVPPLVFNSHIFSSDPIARRVMVNNVYLREGQPFNGMVVQEITDEGAILVLDGVMFEVNAARGWGRR